VPELAPTEQVPTGDERLSNISKPSKNGGPPVLLFDKTSVHSHPAIALLTVSEVAELLKISISGVRRLQQGRHLPFIKVGGSVRFSESDVMSYLKRRRVESID
jgi:excisionase family DNA binding protein